MMFRSIEPTGDERMNTFRLEGEKAVQRKSLTEPFHDTTTSILPDNVNSISGQIDVLKVPDPAEGTYIICPLSFLK